MHTQMHAHRVTAVWFVQVIEGSEFIKVRHPELKLNTPPWLFCMSWCPDFEFRGTQGGKDFVLMQCLLDGNGRAHGGAVAEQQQQRGAQPAAGGGGEAEGPCCCSCGEWLGGPADGVEHCANCLAERPWR